MGDRFVQFPVCSFFFYVSFVFIMMMTGCKNTFMKKEDFKTLLFFLFIVASHLLITSFIYTHHKKLPTL